MTAQVFLAYADYFLACVLQPGNLVVMDNLDANEVAGVTEAIRLTKTSILNLPPYSPDLSPIERMFAKLKALICRAAVDS